MLGCGGVEGLVGVCSGPGLLLRHCFSVVKFVYERRGVYLMNSVHAMLALPRENNRNFQFGKRNANHKL